MRGVRVHGRRAALAAMAALAITGLAMLGGAQPAWAADSDFDSWHATYTVGADGVVHVQETLVYRFGSSDAGHGIYRDLTTREPWGDTDEDAVYTISNITVSSPDASAQFTTATRGAGTRTQELRIQVGSSSQRVTTPTATYLLSYDLAGALRTSGSYDELYWNVVPSGVAVRDIAVTVSVPGGVRQVACYNGSSGSRDACSSAQIGADGTATYTVASKSSGSIVTIAAMIGSGLVSDNVPNLQPRASAPNPWTLAIVGAEVLVAALVCVLFIRLRCRDRRFAGVAPGVVPEASDAPVAEDDRPTIPVAFAPPALPVAMGGLLQDGSVDVRDTTATLVSLAVRGAIQLRQGKGKAEKAPVFGTLVDPTVEMTAYEARVLRDIFGKRGKKYDDDPLPVGAEQKLSKPGKLIKAHKHLVEGVRKQAEQDGFYAHMPTNGAPSTAGVVGISLIWFGIGCVVWLVIAAVSGDFLARLASPVLALAVGLPLFAVLALIVCGLMAMRGRRSALGRARTDQIVGFRRYLATAEADQLEFEEGQDIFSQYLPWAIAFGVAERWTKVCQQLVDQGRLTMNPTWYAGDMVAFHSFVMASAWSQVSAGAVSASSGGGGSAFSGGGGFAGGGGGGGGAGGW
ncbi:MAG: DUF2207 domain-containing protein [Propionibacteriaceae bacterium]|nr:DUF2207 domain-containing protein [Propionibacteriaceae bacterium]